MALWVGFKEVNINWSMWFKFSKEIIDACDHLTLKTRQGAGWSVRLQDGLRQPSIEKLMGTFLDLLWPGKEIGRDSPLTVRMRSLLMLDETVEILCNSNTKSTYSPLRMAFLVFLSMCATRSPELEDGDDSSCCTELGSPKLIFGAIVEGAACLGMLESG